MATEVDYRFMMIWKSSGGTVNPATGREIAKGTAMSTKCQATYDGFIEATKKVSCPNCNGRKKNEHGYCEACFNKQVLAKPIVAKKIPATPTESKQQKVAAEPKAPAKVAEPKAPATLLVDDKEKPTKAVVEKPAKAPVAPKTVIPKSDQVNYVFIRSWRLNNEKNPLTQRAIKKDSPGWKALQATYEAEVAKITPWTKCPNCKRTDQKDGLCVCC